MVKLRYRLLLAVGFLSLLIIPSCRQTPINAPDIPLRLTPPPLAAYDTLTAVSQASIPPRDLVQLTQTVRGIAAPRVVATEPASYQVGDVAPFWYKNLDTQENVQIEAELRYRSVLLNMWFEADVQVNEADVLAAANQIEQAILPINRGYFGIEWQPGVDGDPRLNILHIGKIGGVATAYFLPEDLVVTAVNPFSNQREMLYVNLDKVTLNTDEYFTAVAHEHQHLIQWHTDPNEAAWLNEGMAELAAQLNGYLPSRAQDYVNATDLQLTNLSQSPEVVAGHYAAATLLVDYFYGRFGTELTHQLVQHPENGAAGFTAVFQQNNIPLTFTDLFADWLVTNYLNSIGREQPAYSYASFSLPTIPAQTVRRFPSSLSGSVYQFGADYLEIDSNQPVTVQFTGSQQVPFFPTAARSGSHFFASLPADASATTLTRQVDLSNLENATLTFWAWYDLEPGWDYAYVMASVDDGRSWTLLQTESSRTDNPQGNNLGVGYTGISGQEAPAWQQETADLTPFVGQPILLRFATITDGAVTHPGFLLDDIAIPQLNWHDDAETADPSWQEAGFLRANSVLPQQFVLMRILLGENDVQVDRLTLNENQQGAWQFAMNSDFDTAILIIAGATAVTRQPAAYQLEFVQP